MAASDCSSTSRTPTSVGVKEALTSQVGVVGGVLTQGFKTEAGTMTRLSVSLVKQATYRVRAEGTTLKVLAHAAPTSPEPRARPT